METSQTVTHNQQSQLCVWFELLFSCCFVINNYAPLCMRVCVRACVCAPVVWSVIEMWLLTGLRQSETHIPPV